jgi:hypothetical protein
VTAEVRERIRRELDARKRAELKLEAAARRRVAGPPPEGRQARSRWRQIHGQPCEAFAVTTGAPCTLYADPGERFCGVHEYLAQRWGSEPQAA